MISTANSQISKQLVLGQNFTSFEEFKTTLSEYEMENKQKFSIKGSRKISSATTIKFPIKPELVYYELQYGCIHREGFKPTGKGIRKSSTLRMNCPAVIKLRASKCGDSLIIKEFKEEHVGHELSQTVIDHLPQTRKEDKKKLVHAQNNIKLPSPTNRKQIINQVLSQGGSKTLLLRNIQKYNNNEITNVVRLLEDTYKCTVSVFCSEDETFKGLYFSTPSMRNNMQAWPEFISIHCTYNLIDNGCTIFLILVEDSEGHSKIVAVSIVATEDRDTFAFFLNRFKDENIEACNRIKCFIGNKDMMKREILKKIFPGVPTFITPFHTMKTFRAEINTEHLRISRKERDLSLEYVQKLVHSVSEKEYQDILQEFQIFAPVSVFEYFNKNWNNIKEDWIARNNFLNNKHTRMESINKKIKQVIGRNNNIIQFVNNLFIFIQSQEYERDHHAANRILKRPVSHFKENSCKHKYEMYLTNYSLEYVLQEMDMIESVSIVLPKKGQDNEFFVKSSDNIIKVTSSQCECRNFKSMQLPCKHIFAIRTELNLPLFDEILCDERWTKSYYIDNHKICQQNLEIDSSKNRILTVSEKRKQMLQVTNSLANIGSLSSDSLFEYRLKLLKQIELAWRQGCKVTAEKKVHAETIEVIEDSPEEDETDDERDAVSVLNEPSVQCSSLDQTTEELKSVCEMNDVTQDDQRKLLSEISIPATTKKRVLLRGANMKVIQLKKRRKLLATKELTKN